MELVETKRMYHGVCEQQAAQETEFKTREQDLLTQLQTQKENSSE